MKQHMALDKIIMIVPMLLVIVASLFFAVFPDQSLSVLSAVRDFLGNDVGIMYLLFGLFCFGLTLYLAFSGKGKIRLGETSKPVYSNWLWGSMIFTSTMAADIIFFSLIEWAYYAVEPHVQAQGDLLLWSATMPLFHWGPIVWSFYIVLAISIGYMIHNRGVTRLRLSEMCRGVLGNRVDGVWGKVIDIVAVFGLIAGTATTFSLATPLITAAVAHLSGLTESPIMTIVILLAVASIYTVVVLSGMKGIEKLAKISVTLFVTFLVYVLVLGGQAQFIFETGLAAMGNLTQNFVSLSTWTDSVRADYFPQNWTVFYWAYWVSWSVATPFFIATISKGRTVKNTVFGVYLFGLLGTFTSFIVLGGHGMAQQFLYGTPIAEMIGYVSESALIIDILQTLPTSGLAIALLVVTMIMFYATTFDSLTLVISNYSYQNLSEGTEPSKGVRVFWAVAFIVLPIGLILSEGALYNLQALAIIAAAPIAVIMCLVVWSFFKVSKL